MLWFDRPTHQLEPAVLLNYSPGNAITVAGIKKDLMKDTFTSCVSFFFTYKNRPKRPHSTLECKQKHQKCKTLPAGEKKNVEKEIKHEITRKT